MLCARLTRLTTLGTVILPIRQMGKLRLGKMEHQPRVAELRPTLVTASRSSSSCYTEDSVRSEEELTVLLF